MASEPVLHSVLDLVPIAAGTDAGVALNRSAKLARHAERCGYHRYWVAEHHNIPGVASSATSIVIAHLAAATSTIRVGSGGIMLPNHAPLVIAEQFGTLESLFPARIDLGLGRAPGSDNATSRAIRGSLAATAADRFDADVSELQRYLRGGPGLTVRAIPGDGLQVPLYILGSSDYGARFAAANGLPFAFASHFAPSFLGNATAIYRDAFVPSQQLPAPYVIVGANVVVADTDVQARRQFTSIEQSFLGIIRGARSQIPPPVLSMDSLWTPQERGTIRAMTSCSAVGSVETATQQLQAIVDATNADEIIATANLYDHEARMRSFELAAQAFATVKRSVVQMPTTNREEPSGVSARSASDSRSLRTLS